METNREPEEVVADKPKRERKMTNIEDVLANMDVSVLPSFEGRQPTKWDVLAPKFDKPGTTINWPNTVVSNATASQIAKRLTILTGSQFHSFVDTLKPGTVAVRRREDGWKPSTEVDGSDEEKAEALENTAQEEHVSDGGQPSDD